MSFLKFLITITLISIYTTSGARCYLDDCARCECPLGYYVTNYVKDDIGSIEICIQGTLRHLLNYKLRDPRITVLVEKNTLPTIFRTI